MGIEYNQLPSRASHSTRENVNTFDDLIRARNRFGYNMKNEMAMFKGDGAMDKVDMRWTLRANQLNDFANSVTSAYSKYLRTHNSSHRSLEGARGFKLPYDLYFLLKDGARKLRIDGAEYTIKPSMTSTGNSAAKGSGRMSGRSLHRKPPKKRQLDDFIVHLSVNTNTAGKVLA